MPHGMMPHTVQTRCKLIDEVDYCGHFIVFYYFIVLKLPW